MSLIWQPQERLDVPLGRAPGAERYDIMMRIAVRDAGLLWRAAAAQALTYSGVSGVDIEDTLGPVEDPAIAECLAMIAGPRLIAGCSFESFTMHPVRPALTGPGRRNLP